MFNALYHTSAVERGYLVALHDQGLDAQEISLTMNRDVNMRSKEFLFVLLLLLFSINLMVYFWFTRSELSNVG